MEIERKTIEALCAEIQQLGKEAFVERYPGAFLLAMGRLEAREIRAAVTRRPPKAERLDPTVRFVLGDRPRHDLSVAHPLAGHAFHMGPTPEGTGVRIGRGEKNDVVVPDTSVSERHCRIEIADEGVVIVDLGSTNGTSVNLERLSAGEPVVLADEDILTVGRYSFQLLTAGACYEELSQLRPAQPEEGE
jgi:hypothetical protein